MSSIVDIYDALTADRCYKSGMSSAEAFKILLSLTPNHLDRELVYKFINCIGMYPVGSLVELSDGRVGIVWTSNQSEPLKPVIKCFYSNKYQRYVEVTYLDLKGSSYKIVKAVSPKSLKVDSAPFYEE
ncbi:HD-domain protein [Vibrio astriarenae]|nr:HD-domain protein [Vibrio sp. C7]